MSAAELVSIRASERSTAHWKLKSLLELSAADNGLIWPDNKILTKSLPGQQSPNAASAVSTSVDPRIRVIRIQKK